MFGVVLGALTLFTASIMVLANMLDADEGMSNMEMERMSSRVSSTAAAACRRAVVRRCRTMRSPRRSSGWSRT